MSRTSTNYILISELVLHERICNRHLDGSDACMIFAPMKYMDYTLPKQGVDFYFAQARAFARMCAWYQRSKVVCAQIDELFAPPEMFQGMFDDLIGQCSGPMSDRLQELRKRLASLQMCEVQTIASRFRSFPEEIASSFVSYGLEFLDTATALFPEAVQTSDFRIRFEEEAFRFCKSSGFINMVMMKAFPELFVLAHTNLQIDNGFFWFDSSGILQAGLLDWGGVGHAHVCQVLAAAWHGAEVAVMDEYEDKLCDFFVHEVIAAGGVCCDEETMRILVKCSRGASMPMYFANFSRLSTHIPKKEWSSITGRVDPRISDNFLIRCYTVAPALIISGHYSRNPIHALDKLAEVLDIRTDMI
eukprot:TRINITY_DN26535_c0_g1_i1.p1 TRINITY_DN26535_c0_g1~~TRINITY_DN26535_c0_g1_i1.p1  ORF type:complete len:359 (+),score=50.72 TRINITY_DN26535_c0_g1_i1:953-2029(+)